MNRALLVFVLSTIPFAGCTEPASQPGSDAAVDAYRRCDPHAGVCRATVRCAFDDSDGLRLSDGEVRPLAPTWDYDISGDDGRFYVLHGGGGLCRFGESASGTASFDSLEDIPTDESSCTWELGSVLYFGHGEAPGGGQGFLLRDTGDQLYRVRIAQAQLEADTLTLDLEWSAI